jgi:hypothetical protein
MYLRGEGLLTVILGALCLFSPAVLAQQAENPYVQAKVGDWISFRIRTGGAGPDMTMRQVVTAKDAEHATVKLEIKAGNQPLPTQEQKIPLKEPFDASKVSLLGMGQTKVDTKKLDEGKETIEVGGKKYDCSWVKNQVTLDLMGQKITSTSKIWTSPELPFGGMLKVENEINNRKVTVEYTGHGTAK